MNISPWAVVSGAGVPLILGHAAWMWWRAGKSGLFDGPSAPKPPQVKAMTYLGLGMRRSFLWNYLSLAPMSLGVFIDYTKEIISWPPILEAISGWIIVTSLALSAALIFFQTYWARPRWMVPSVLRHEPGKILAEQSGVTPLEIYYGRYPGSPREHPGFPGSSEARS